MLRLCHSDSISHVDVQLLRRLSAAEVLREAQAKQVERQIAQTGESRGRVARRKRLKSLGNIGGPSGEGPVRLVSRHLDHVWARPPRDALDELGADDREEHRINKAEQHVIQLALGVRNATLQKV